VLSIIYPVSHVGSNWVPGGAAYAECTLVHCQPNVRRAAFSHQTEVKSTKGKRAATTIPTAAIQTNVYAGITTTSRSTSPSIAVCDMSFTGVSSLQRRGAKIALKRSSTID